MRLVLKLFPLLLLFGAMAGCDPTVDAEDTSATDPITAKVASVKLITESPQISSGGADAAKVTAIVKDANNTLIEGATVGFGVNSDASVQVENAGVTDASGMAHADVYTTGNPENRTITVTASSSNDSDSVNIDVVGTSIQVAGADSTVQGNKIPLTLLVEDGAGNPIAGKELAVSSSRGNGLSASTVTTDSSGSAEVIVTATTDGKDTITISGLGVTTLFTLNVDDSDFRFTAPSSGSTVILNKIPPTTVSVLYAEGGGAQVGVEVNFAATRGTLNPTSATTNAQGIAEVTIQSNNAGPVIVSASVDNGPSTQLEFEFVADTPAKVDVQANPASVGTNGDTSTLTAVVRDAAGNPVKDKRVLFTLVDFTGGSIAPGSARTDSLGRASTIYTSSSVSSGAGDGRPKVTARVDGTSIEDNVTLTVAEAELFISFGTGNDLKDIDDTRIEMPFTLFVTDANGGGIPNVEVQLSVLPPQSGFAYRKGWWQLADTDAMPDGEADDWVQNLAVSCVNEDINRNGILETGEDVNGNGSIEPANNALVVGSVTTDATGLAEFDVIYPKEFAYWTWVELSARTNVSGTESTRSTTFTLPGIGSDYDKVNVSPPGVISPFGQNASCASPD